MIGVTIGNVAAGQVHRVPSSNSYAFCVPCGGSDVIRIPYSDSDMIRALFSGMDGIRHFGGNYQSAHEYPSQWNEH